jgi:hypothetical protein
MKISNVSLMSDIYISMIYMIYIIDYIIYHANPVYWFAIFYLIIIRYFTDRYFTGTLVDIFTLIFSIMKISNVSLMSDIYIHDIYDIYN